MQVLPIVGGSVQEPNKAFSYLTAIIGIVIIWQVIKKMGKAVGM
jgi:hypothetical protein